MSGVLLAMAVPPLILVLALLLGRVETALDRESPPRPSAGPRGVRPRIRRARR